MKMAKSDRAVYRRLWALRKTNSNWELVFQEQASKAAPEWKPVVPGTMTTLSDGTLAYLFDAGSTK